MPVLDNPRPPPEVEPEEEDSSGPPGPVIGIIYPPPEVRNIVDKTASFVARNGPEFEARIRQNELGNPKFNFLSVGDPYHAYYQHKVKDFRDGKGDVGSSGGNLGVAMQRLAVTPAAAQRQQELLKAATEPPPPTHAPPEFEFIADPPSISALDLDIVKLTAQFVARNGRQFLTNLMNREQRNYQFDFLRPQHSLFHYFTRLLEQYTKVLLPPKELLTKLTEEASSSEIILQQAQTRAAWLAHQQAQKQRDELKLEKERIAYASIDWHDFVVVETVDYQGMEMGNFPPPTTPDEVGARVLMQERMDDGVEEIEMQLESDEEKEGDTSSGEEALDSGEENEEEGLSKMEDRTGATGGRAQDDTQVRDMEEDSSSSGEDEEESESSMVLPPGGTRKEAVGRRAAQPPPLPPQADRVIVKKYDPKQAKRDAISSSGGNAVGGGAGEEWLISPITGERIPAHKVQEHMRIGLLDPRWLEQRDRALGDRATQDAVLAQGSAIEASLKQLAERRTDIFGVGDEETAIGKKIGEEEVRKDDRVTWDGHTSSVEAATRAARANITLEEQIHQIHKVKGLLPDEEKEKIGPKPVVPGSGGQPKQTHQQQPTVTPPQQPKPIQPPPQPVPMMAGVQGVVPPLGGMMPPLPPLMVMSSLTPLAPPRPPIMGGFPGFPPAPPAPPPAVEVTSTPSDDEPPPKRARTEEQLMPETHFLQLHPGQISFSVVVPSVPERSEWQLTGQRVPLRLPASTSVAALKQRLHQITSMPPAKQKLHLDGLFFKDSNSLAYYNVAPGSVLQLQVKERGGRKK